ncbi:MAG: hypothetical protein AAF611_12645 [Bacteroidota bacterium]
MTTEILKTDWFLNEKNFEGTVSFRGKNGGIIQAFSYGVELKERQQIALDLNALYADLEWEIIFSENRDKEIKIERKGDWEYEAYGIIRTINPVMIDFGEFELDTGNWTNDEKVIGSYVYWKIDRLDII